MGHFSFKPPYMCFVSGLLKLLLGGNWGAEQDVKEPGKAEVAGCNARGSSILFVYLPAAFIISH